MKKKKFFLKLCGLITCFVLILIASFVFTFINVTRGTHLDSNKFVKATNMQLSVYDSQNNLIDSDEIFDSNGYVSLKDLPSYTPKAFIATEDKRFYSHGGIDLKRMFGATARNIKNRKFSQGASTITQQLIKNTHLTQEKTMTRKMKEIKLAVELEHMLTKDEILEQYLNSIYFGNGAYGIENASKKYFGKNAKNLTVGESAMLAGIIKAPTYFDPINKNEACEERKKVVLSCMKNQGIISEDEYQKNANNRENIVKNTSKSANLYNKIIISEVCKNLNITENQLKNMKIEIISSIDKDLNSKIKDIVKSDKYTVNGENNNPISCAVFVIDNVTKNIIAVYSENCSNILTKKRQPGSIIKPILVYAPAIEYGLITPETIVKDEPIDINGYTPKNANKKYSGNVTVSEALQKSLNVPTVKILSNVGVNKAKSFANNLGITFDEKDQNLALALGGMTNGLTVKEIADAYSAFASYGDYAQSNIIKEIKDENGNILWKDNKVKASAMKQSTAFLITNILEGTRKNGTTRRLASFDFQIASKTGTVGSGIDNSNQEAYCVAYTSEHTIVTWFGENEKSGHLPSNVNGSTYPTMLIKDVLTFLYKDHKPNDFTIPASVVKLPLDSRSQQIYGRTELARQNMPERYKKEAYFATDNLPKESTFDLPHKTTLNVVMDEGNKPTLFFDTKKENKYIIIRDDLTTKTHAEIYSTLGTGQKHQFIDETTIKSHVYEYKVIVFNINNENEQYISNKIKLLSY